MKSFDNYVRQFDLSNEITKMKYNHSYRVSETSKLIATRMKFSKDEIELAELIGLIHDIGRFEQVEKFNTLSDIGTMDHASYGAYLLDEKKYIDKFVYNYNDRKLIIEAVDKHNKYFIEEEKYDAYSLRQIKLIRDADKVDIFNIWANLDELELKDDGEISYDVKQDFLFEQMVHNEYKKTNADQIIGTLSYIYDINYKETYKYIVENNLLWKLFDRLEDKVKFYDYFVKASDYITKQISKGYKFMNKETKKNNKSKRKMKNCVGKEI